ncbi:MAG: metallopeptidase family protein, partial [Pseudomonadota bacterium]
MATFDSSAAWKNRFAPSQQEVETLARLSFSALPAAFHRKAGKIIIQVQDYPTQALADHLALETPFDLLGIFEGHGSRDYWTPPHIEQTGENTLILFRRAILDYWCENNESLDDIIAHVVITELGHHFGLTDKEMRDLEME